MAKNNLPEVLVKKMDIAKRICEPMNDKRFKWEATEEEGLYRLAGVKSQVLYQDVKTEKHPKGFRVLNASGKKVICEPTLNVGIFLKTFVNELFEALEPAPETPAAEPAH